MLQEQIARHYANIRRYRPGRNLCLAELYVADDRYLAIDEAPNPGFASFMRNAMIYFADTKLK
jgi:hypothetical protein